VTDVHLTIQRSAHEIGGNCLELATADGHRLLLDAGRPLDAPEGATTGLIPATLDTARPVDAVLLSHPHQDHYGLLGDLPATWPVYCGPACEKLVRLTAGIFGADPPQPFTSWEGRVPFEVGPFKVTPYLTDHSAFDAYMLLVEVHGKRLLYSGDFRLHGRKGTLTRAMMARPPASLDALVMEGTNLGSDKACTTEDDLEARFTDLLQSTAGRVFVAWSAQNVDRTVTLYRARLRTNRTLVVDLYTAEVMELLAKFGRLPRPGWRNLKVVVTGGFARMYEKTGREAFLQRMVKFGIAAGKLTETPERWVVMTRRSLIRDYERKGVVPTPQDAWSWSMWLGYLQNNDGRQVQAWFDSQQCPPAHVHTSGHASHADLRRFARAINPRVLIPIHGTAWDQEGAGFPAIHRLADGEPLTL
jgi:ribonuclease J